MLFYNFSKFWVLGDVVQKNYMALLGLQKKIVVPGGAKIWPCAFFRVNFFRVIILLVDFFPKKKAM